MKSPRVFVFSCGLALSAFCSPLLSQEISLTGVNEEQLELIQLAINSPTPKGFLEEADGFWNQQRHGLSEITKEQIRLAFSSRAYSFLEVDAVLEAADSGDLTRLLLWASHSLNTDEKRALEQRLAEVLENQVELGEFEAFQLSTKFNSILTGSSYGERSQVTQAVRNWIDSNDISPLDAAQLDWCFLNSHPVIRNIDGFSAIWTGSVTPGRGGDYVFSIDPCDMNTQYIEDGQHVFNLRNCKVLLGEELIIDASEEEWNSVSLPVTLSAGESLPLRVEFVNRWLNDHHRYCPVVLKWTGPGFEEQIVPERVLSTPEGQPGLKGEYRWKEDVDGRLEEVVEQTVDSRIEFYWEDCLIINVQDDAMQKLAAEHVSRWISSDGNFLRDIARRPHLVSMLTGKQVSQCLQHFLAQPESLGEVSRERLARFYPAVRCADEELAISLLGNWLTRHSYVPLYFAGNWADYFDLNREFYYRIAEFIYHENPDRMKRLEEDFLRIDGSDLCLSTAAALAECHLAQGSINSWTEVLETQLADDALDEVVRVHWLLARAHAEELKYASANRYYRVKEELGAGRDWLVEAELITSSEEEQLKIAREAVARLVALNQWEAAESRMARISPLSERASREVEKWKVEIENLELSAGEAKQEQNLVAKRDIMRELLRRRDRAQASGNQQARERYDALLSNMSSESQ